MIYQETQICDICYNVHDTSVKIVHSLDRKENLNVGFNIHVIGHNSDRIQLSGKQIFKRLPKKCVVLGNKHIPG